MNADAPTSPLYTPLPHKGGMAFKGTNILIEHWIQSWDHNHPLLDIGCGSCNNVKRAIDARATVFAAEMDQQALNNHRETYRDISNLSFHYLKLPHEVSFSDNSFSGILCSEVFHFLRHADVVSTIWELHRLLVPGGKAIITCASEDTEAFKESDLKHRQAQARIHSPLKINLIPDYNAFVKKIIDSNLPSNKATEIYELLEQKVLPTTYFTCFNSDQLAMIFKRLGFNIELLETGPAKHYPIWEHGNNDQVRLVAVKR